LLQVCLRDLGFVAEETVEFELLCLDLLKHVLQ
jgi:hypothetical protein